VGRKKGTRFIVVCPFCGKQFHVSLGSYCREVIVELLKDKCLTFNEIVKETGFSKATISKHLKRLIKDGLIKRKIVRDYNTLRLKSFYFYNQASDSP